LSVVVTVLVGLVLILLAVTLYAWPTMLVLGWLHASNGLAWVPALGFWQTAGAIFVVRGLTGGGTRSVEID
jgi:hypothetical protein